MEDIVEQKNKKIISNYNSLINFLILFLTILAIYHIIIKIIGTLNDKNTLLLMNILSE